MAARIDSEPIPTFTPESRYKLDTCLKQVRQDYYPGILSKAAHLFYFISKNHPLPNGNKRMAVACTMIFLALNGYWTKLDVNAVVNMARWVVRTSTSNKEAAISAIEHMLANNLVNFDTDTPIPYEDALNI